MNIVNSLLFVVYQSTWILSNHEIKKSANICHHINIYWLEQAIFEFTFSRNFFSTKHDILYPRIYTVLEMKIWICWYESNSWIYFYIVQNKNWENVLVRTKLYWSWTGGLVKLYWSWTGGLVLIVRTVYMILSKYLADLNNRIKTYDERDNVRVLNTEYQSPNRYSTKEPIRPSPTLQRT